MFLQSAVNHFIRRLFNGMEFFTGHDTGFQSVIGTCGGFFQHPKGMDHFRRHGFGTDFEIVQTALSLCAPVTFRRNAYHSHGVMFFPVFHKNFRLSSQIVFHKLFSGV